MEKQEKVHVLVLPIPVQGHINPMLQFAKRLVSKGLKITLVTAFINAESIQARAGEIEIENISDTTEVDRDVSNAEAFLKEFHELVSLKLPQVIEKLKYTGNPAGYLIYDSVAPQALDIAKQLGLPGAPFFTQSCAVNVLFYNMPQGLLRVPVEDKEPPMSMTGLPQLELFDLPSFVYDMVSYPSLLANLANQFSNFREADCIFFNTFESLEEEVHSSQWIKAKDNPSDPNKLILCYAAHSMAVLTHCHNIVDK